MLPMRVDRDKAIAAGPAPLYPLWIAGANQGAHERVGAGSRGWTSKTIMWGSEGTDLLLKNI